MASKSQSINKKLEKTLRILGQQIRDRREELKISSTVTAEAAEISRVTLYRIEKGEPSVAMGAYMSVISALGLTIELPHANTGKAALNATSKLPSKIPIAKYKQLKKLAWQLKATTELSPEDALDLYERNWRHVDIKAMDAKEKKLIQTLLATFNRGRLLV